MAKKPNMQDATLRHIRAIKKRVAALTERVAVLENAAVRRVGGRKR